MSQRDNGFGRAHRDTAVVIGGLPTSTMLDAELAVVEPNSSIKEHFHSAYIAGPILQDERGAGSVICA